MVTGTGLKLYFSGGPALLKTFKFFNLVQRSKLTHSGIIVEQCVAEQHKGNERRYLPS